MQSLSDFHNKYLSKMIRSLRSLCLLKVCSEEMDYVGLPSNLVKDLNIMKLFNGNFSVVERRFDEEGVVNLELSALEVLFDGVSWSFSSRSSCMPIYCCNICNVFQTRLYKLLMVTEGELVRTASLFSQVREWFAEMEDNFEAEFKKFETEILVDFGQDILSGWSGKITFHGTGELGIFNVTVEVVTSLLGPRVMLQRGTATCGSKTMEFSNTLSETTGSFFKIGFTIIVFIVECNLS